MSANSTSFPYIVQSSFLIDEHDKIYLRSRVLSIAKVFTRYAVFGWVLLMMSLSAIAQVPENLPDGLYQIDDKGKFTPVGNEIEKATLVSQDNANEHWDLSIWSKSPFPLSKSKLAFVLAGESVPMTSWSGHDNIAYHINGRTSSKAQGEAAIHLYHPTVMERKHPGYLIMAQFKPAKATFSIGEPVMIKLKITNVGDKDFTFIQGGRQRGARDNQFAFTMEYDIIPDTGDPQHTGGKGAFITVKPGETKGVEVDLTKWFKFEKPGAYYIRGSYYLLFVNPPGLKKHEMLWEDYASGEFEIKIAK